MLDSRRHTIVSGSMEDFPIERTCVKLVKLLKLIPGVAVLPLLLIFLCAPAAPALEHHNAVPRQLEVNLGEAVLLALRTNRTVKSAFLDRVVQKFDLEVARDKFNPNLDLSATTGYAGGKTDTQGSGWSSRTDVDLGAALTAEKQIETGGRFTFVWTRGDSLSESTDIDQSRDSTNSWSVNFSQPLLKGAGKDVNTASVALAELSEQSNLLSYRDTIISTVNSTISAFRSYAQSARALEISKASLERSRASQEINRVMIAMGRLPANEIIQSEADVASQEFSHETALNDVDNARLNLLKVLDLPRDTRITPIEEIRMDRNHPALDKCLALAFKNRSDYLNAKMSLKQSQINLLLARDNMKWSLQLTSGMSATDSNYRHSSDSDAYEWNVGLQLDVPLYGDLTREQVLLGAETSLKQAKISLEEIEQNINIEVADAVRNVETRLKQVGMAERSRILAEKKLAVEMEKLKVGRTTNFQVVSFQNDLTSSQNAEVNARVDYLNALTTLDTTLGTTLQTWQIDYNKEYDKWPGK